MRLRYRIQSLMASLRWKIQRFKRGYSDVDVWEFESWFLEIIPKMLTQLKEELHGHPVDMEFEDWEKYLEKMIDHFNVASTIDDFDDIEINYTSMTEEDRSAMAKKYLEKNKRCQEELHKGLKMLDERFFDLWD